MSNSFHDEYLRATDNGYITDRLIILCLAENMIDMACFQIDMVLIEDNYVVIYHSHGITMHMGVVTAANPVFFEIYVHPVY
jgi:hypothetical protein